PGAAPPAAPAASTPAGGSRRRTTIRRFLPGRGSAATSSSASGSQSAPFRVAEATMTSVARSSAARSGSSSSPRADTDSWAVTTIVLLLGISCPAVDDPLRAGPREISQQSSPYSDEPSKSRRVTGRRTLRDDLGTGDELSGTGPGSAVRPAPPSELRRRGSRPRPSVPPARH